MKGLKLHNGVLANDGDIVCWDVWDGDDNKTWTFEGEYKCGSVIYIGGGSDNGTAKGKQMAVEDVIEQAYNNDVPRGVWLKTILCLDCGKKIDHATAPKHGCAI